MRARHGDAVHVCSGIGHSFMRDGHPSHHRDTAYDAWDRTLAFFDEHLAQV